MLILPALLASGLLASLGSYFLKRSTDRGLSVRLLIRTPQLYLGGMLYVASALLNMYLLKILPYSLVVPLGSLTYVWTLLLSRFLLGEPVTRSKLIGIGLILGGVTLIALS